MPKNGKVPTRKRYLDEMKGLPIQDVSAETGSRSKGALGLSNTKARQVDGTSDSIVYGT